jgi:hypothetical protein
MARDTIKMSVYRNTITGEIRFLTLGRFHNELAAEPYEFIGVITVNLTV